MIVHLGVPRGVTMRYMSRALRLTISVIRIFVPIQLGIAVLVRMILITGDTRISIRRTAWI